MKVRLKKPSRRYTDLTFGNVYRVIGIEANDYRIMNDDGRPYLYPPRLFEVVDPNRPEDWIVKTYPDRAIYAYPPELNRPGFFEDWFDYKPSVMAKLESYLQHQRATERRSA